MTDGLAAVLDDVGAEVFGAAWTAFRPHVRLWLNANPDGAQRIRARIRAAVREGRL